MTKRFKFPLGICVILTILWALPIATEDVFSNKPSPDYDPAGHVLFDFVCGDATGNGKVDIADCVFLANFLYRGGPYPDPYEAGDTNGDGGIDIGDIVYLVNYLYKGGPEPIC